MKVLVVDDSVTFRSQIKRALCEIEGVEVVGSASNGRVAKQWIEQKPVDLVILDLNMPEMSGLDLLAEVKPRGRGLDVIVFAGRTERSAEETMRALALGAADFVVKPNGQAIDFETAYLSIAEQLVPKVRQFLERPLPVPAAAPVVVPPRPRARLQVETFVADVVLIASSTGGPGALEALLKRVESTPRVPILIAQHMPETFTKHLAARLESVAGIPCREAVHGELLQNGMAYVAPGDYHLLVVPAEAGPRKARLALDQSPKANGVRPAADLLFQSAVRVFGPRCLAFVLTGMGQDGLVGVEHVKRAGGCVVIQDQASSVVWGMPGAVHAADLYDSVASIEECGRILARLTTAQKAVG